MENGTRKRVLVVDDDPEVLRTMNQLLRRRGVDVQVAFGAEQALEALGTSDYSAVVVDFNMHGPNGAWLLRQVRDRYPELSRILLSGSSYRELSPHLEPGLVHSFLEKPLELDELMALVG